MDFGFGITGESYYDTARFLHEHRKDIPVIQLKEMPESFLYRHSIELFLKSLIIIFHKKLKINYDQEPPTSKQPKVFSKGKWMNLYRCHWIDELYLYWKDHLLIPNLETLKEIAPRGDWREYEQITKALPIIAKYDRESSFFRYPVTENAAQDLEKFTMQPLDVDKLFERLGTKPKPGEGGIEEKPSMIMALKNDDNDIVKAYIHTDDILADVTSALQIVSHDFYCIHFMARVELCGGH